MEDAETQSSGTAGLPDLPRAITSFGAARLDDAAYVYGGHFGKAHHYYNEGQSGDLLRVDLTKPAGWEVVGSGPRLQGLALVAHDGRLYRVGGFEARNTQEQEQNLWSVADFACFEPQDREWRDLPPMPEPRSSFDAAVIGSRLYVVGGWSMQGDRDALWHGTALAIDLSAEPHVWKPIPNPPFKRRALALGEAAGRLCAIGGMQPDGKVSPRTAIFDPASGAWSPGPEISGGEMEGFGAACCALEGRLYVSTSSGQLLRLSDDAKSWERVGKLRHGRFFHRMLPISAGRLMAIGGANMSRGKFSDVELLDLRIDGSKNFADP